MNLSNSITTQFEIYFDIQLRNDLRHQLQFESRNQVLTLLVNTLYKKFIQ